MKNISLLLMACMVTMLAVAQTETSVQPADSTSSGEPPRLGITWAKGTPQDLALSSPASSPNMTYHGGKIMPTANVTAIFWGTSWANYHGDKISGTDSWYQGFGNSNYAKTSDEYTGSNGQVGPTTNYAGHYIDTSAAGDGNDASAILAEVCKMITNPDPSGNGYYPVYVDKGRGRNSYCAYHSVGSCRGTPVQFAFFFDLDSDPGCDPGDTSGLHSQGLAALSNVSGHELSEARTDPAYPGAWYDSAGQENGDKCAWSFGIPLVSFSNGTQWKIQGEWSNSAYNKGTGYPNRGGQKGCLSGTGDETCHGAQYLYANQGLYPGQLICSNDGRFRLILQYDGNLVLYQGDNPLWGSNTVGKASAVAVMQGDGNFVIYDTRGRPIWASNTPNHPGAYLVIQDDGNVVIYYNTRPIWATNTCCH